MHQHARHADFRLTKPPRSRECGCLPFQSKYTVGSQRLNQPSLFLQWQVSVGQWVKARDIVAQYQVKSFNAHHASRGKISTEATILAPCAGQITEIGRIESFAWSWEGLVPGRESGYWWEEECDSRNFLQPDAQLLAIETPAEECDLRAYRSYENIVDYGYFAREGCDAPLGGLSALLRVGPKSMFVPEDFPVEALEGLANARLRIDNLP